MEVEVHFEPPQTGKEVELAKIWSSLLKIDISTIHRHSSFFELGGDSISSIKLISLARNIGLELSTSLIFKKSTLSQMSLLEKPIEEALVKPLIIR